MAQLKKKDIRRYFKLTSNDGGKSHYFETIEQLVAWRKSNGDASGDFSIVDVESNAGSLSPVIETEIFWCMASF